MPDFGKLFEGFGKLLEQVFNGTPPTWIVTVVAALLLLFGSLFIIGQMIGIWNERFRPLFYDPDERRRVLRRQRFASHIESEIRRLNNLEAWQDYRFTELEAEVEAEGKRRVRTWIPFFSRTRTTLRREKSLSKALRASQERLILVEGDPGSGKSVALRFVAQVMAERSRHSRNSKSVIPIYINLKGLERKKREKIDATLIREFVLSSLNRINDRDIEEFLDDEFDRGMNEGTWFFLFDSFDEIPEVLGSTETDSTIRSYTNAITDFLHGMNQSRGIVASRHFRGPGGLGWSRFRIMPLSDQRRIDLVRRFGLEPRIETTINGRISMGSPEILSMSSNPMFLSLLCDHMRDGKPFPENIYAVFETYVQRRLERDQDRVAKRFRLGIQEIRTTAENVAFCMAADNNLGLTPSRAAIRNSLNKLGMNVSQRLDTELDALEFIKLSRSETTVTVGESRSFTFSHRRFQEYFATCVVLREQDRISPRVLLTDARWRDTAVVMCQTQSLDSLESLIVEAHQILIEMNSFLEKVNESQNPTTEHKDTPENVYTVFQWPPGTVHLLGLLQDGFVNRQAELPSEIRNLTYQLVKAAFTKGDLLSKKEAVSIAGIIPKENLVDLLRDSFQSRSQFLRDAAYRQTAFVGDLPLDIIKFVRTTVASMMLDGTLRYQRYAVHAHISRINNSANLLSDLRLLNWIPIIDTVFYFIAYSMCSYLMLMALPDYRIPLGIALIFTCPLIYALFRIQSGTALFPQLFWAIFTLGRRTSRSIRFRNAVFGVMFDVMYFRGFITVMAVATISFRYEWSMPIILTAVIVMYLLMWSPLVTSFAVYGYVVRPAFWLFMPLTGTLYALLKARFPTRKQLSNLTYVLVAAIIVLFVSVAGALIFQSIPVSVAVIGITILWVGIVARNSTRFLQDYRRYHKSGHRLATDISASDLLDNLRLYRTTKYCIQIIRDIRANNSLRSTTETEEMLRWYCRATERQLVKNKAKVQLPEHLSFSDKDIVASYEFLDEMLKLVEQIRANRQGISVDISSTGQDSSK